MDNPIPRKAKIEFWVTEGDKQRFSRLCKRAGYTVAEAMRRAFDAQTVELDRKMIYGTPS